VWDRIITAASVRKVYALAPLFVHPSSAHLSTNFLVQPGTCHGPFAFDRSRGNFQKLCYFFHGEAAKELHFHNPALSFILQCQTAKGLVKREQFARLLS